MMKKIFVFIYFSLILFLNNSYSYELTNKDLEEYFNNSSGKESWYGIYDYSGKKIGWEHYNEFKEDDSWILKISGELWIEDSIESEKTQNKYHYDVKFNFDINYPYSLSYFEKKTKIDSDISLLQASINNGIVSAIQNNNGLINKTVINNFFYSFSELNKTYILLHNKKILIPGDKIKYDYFNFDTFDITNETDKILSIKTKYIDGIKVQYYVIETEKSDAGLGFTSFVTTDGTLLEYNYSDYRILLESKEQAKLNLTYGGSSYDDIGVILVDKLIENSESRKNLRLFIDGEYSDEFIYLNSNQSIVKENDTHFLVLNQNTNNFDAVSKDEVKKNLRETINYPIHNKLILEKLDFILPDKTISDAEKVSKILNFVYEYIEDSYSSNSFNVFDILERKKGDCTEHALLFNTLVRASGIPSREVSGLVYDFENKFYFHAWNEVVINERWVPVDPTWNYNPNPITSIKFNENIDLSKVNFSFRMINQ